VASTAVPAAIWTVDSESGRADTSGQPPGSPSGAEVRRAGAALAQGSSAPSLGELDQAEREVMQLRTRAMPQGVSGIVGIVLILFALRYGFGVMTSIFSLSTLLRAPQALGNRPGLQLVLYGELFANVLILIGILIGLAVIFNIGNLAMRLPGFSSPASRTRTITWVAYAGVMAALLVVLNIGLPAAAGSGIGNGGQDQYAHVTVTPADDGSETYVSTGGDLTVDLSTWPSSEWAGVTFKTSNPSILSLDSTPSAGARPVAVFTARQGAARVDATSSDGRYTFQVRVNVVTSSS
jgi:hypothetical protein